MGYQKNLAKDQKKQKACKEGALKRVLDLEPL